jgi:hypothetical protein
MAADSPTAPNVVKFRRPYIRDRALTDALVHVSTVRAMPAPLDDASAGTRFDRDSARVLVGNAFLELAQAVGNIERSYERARTATSKPEEPINKLLQAKSILQCVAAVFDNDDIPLPVEPSWALGAAVGLIYEALSHPGGDKEDAQDHLCYAAAIAETVLAAHDTRDSHCRNLELSLVLGAAVVAIDRAVDALSRRPLAPKPRAKKARLSVVRGAQSGVPPASVDRKERPHMPSTQCRSTISLEAACT